MSRSLAVTYSEPLSPENWNIQIDDGLRDKITGKGRILNVSHLLYEAAHVVQCSCWNKYWIGKRLLAYHFGLHFVAYNMCFTRLFHVHVHVHVHVRVRVVINGASLVMIMVLMTWVDEGDNEVVVWISKMSTCTYVMVNIYYIYYIYNMIYGNSLHPNMIKTTKQLCTTRNSQPSKSEHSYSKE